jgi:hypothetical protein
MIMRVVMREGFTGLLRQQFGAETILPLTDTRARR